MYNQLTTNKNKMYKNISKGLLAAASLAMMAAADQFITVTEDELREMNENDEKFVMSTEENLTLYVSDGAHYRLYMQ